MVGSLVNQLERARTVGSQADRGPVRIGVGLSLVLHAAVILCLWFPARRALMPDAASGSVELVLTPPEPEQVASSSPVEPSQETATAATPDLAPTLDQALPAEPPASPEQPTEPAPEAISPAAPVVTESATPVVTEPPPSPKPRPAREARPLRSVQTRPTPPVRAPVSHAQTLNTSGSTDPAATPSEAPAAPGPAQPAASAAPDSGWLAGVGAWLLAHRSYPGMARALGQQGTVVVRITVDPNGHVEDVDLIHGSGSDSLDHAAEALVRDAHLPPFPPDMRMLRQTVTVPIRYRLE
jgi:periplasmic protein TonB